MILKISQPYATVTSSGFYESDLYHVLVNRRLTAFSTITKLCGDFGSFSLYPKKCLLSGPAVESTLLSPELEM